MSDTDKNLPDLVSGIRFAMLTTSGRQGLDSRPLTVQRVDDDATVWFLIGQDADWRDQLDRSVNVAFVDKDTWVSVTGTASTTADPAVLDDLGDPVADTYFNENDPLALKVVCDHASWWTSPGGLATALELMRAKATGDQPDAGDHGEMAGG